MANDAVVTAHQTSSSSVN